MFNPFYLDVYFYIKATGIIFDELDILKKSRNLVSGFLSAISLLILKKKSRKMIVLYLFVRSIDTIFTDVQIKGIFNNNRILTLDDKMVHYFFRNLKWIKCLVICHYTFNNAKSTVQLLCNG